VYLCVCVCVCVLSYISNVCALSFRQYRLHGVCVGCVCVCACVCMCVRGCVCVCFIKYLKCLKLVM